MRHLQHIKQSLVVWKVFVRKIFALKIFALTRFYLLNPCMEKQKNGLVKALALTGGLIASQLGNAALVGCNYSGKSGSCFYEFEDESNKFTMETGIPTANLNGGSVGGISDWTLTNIGTDGDGNGILEYEANGANAQDGDFASFNFSTTGLPQGLELYAQASELFAVEGPSHITQDTYLAPQVSTAVPVPVPASAWLFGSALLGLMAKREKQGQSKY